MTDDLKTLIEQTIRSELKDVIIESVDIETDFDFDGDEVLRVSIVFSAEKEFDVQHAKGLARHIRSKLMERSESYAFPLLSFLSAADSKRLRAAAG